MFDKKILLIVISIAVAALAIVLILGLSSQEKKRLTQEITALQDEKRVLNTKLQEIEIENKQFKERVSSLNKNLEKLGLEKSEIQAKFDTVLEEKQSLQEQVVSLNEQLVTAQKQTSYIPPPKIEEPTPQPAKISDDAYWADMLRKKAELELQLENAGSELKTAKLNNEQLQTQISSLTRDNSALKKDLDYNTKMVDKLTLEMTREKTDKYQIEKNLRSLESENASLREQLNEISERKMDLEKDLAELESKNSELENSLAKMEVFVRQKLLQIDGLMEGLEDTQKAPVSSEEASEYSQKNKGPVQLQPIIVRPQGARGKKESVQNKGSVLLVNKENNFVIINLGESAGVKKGDTFKAYNHQGVAVADLEVIQVRPNIAACDIKPAKAAIAVGFGVN